MPNIAQKQQKSRSKHSAKPQLKSLIEQINLLPPEKKLWEFADLLRLVTAEKSEMVEGSESGIALSRCLADLPNELRKQLGLPSKKAMAYLMDESLLRAVSLYEDFRLSRLKLCSLAHGNRIQKARPQFSLGLLSASFSEVASFTLDHEGKIRFIKSSYAEAVEGMEADRIRECERERCKRIFWAQRKDAVCCSPKCAHQRQSDLSYKRKKAETPHHRKLRTLNSKK